MTAKGLEGKVTNSSDGGLSLTYQAWAVPMTAMTTEDVVMEAKMPQRKTLKNFD